MLFFIFLKQVVLLKSQKKHIIFFSQRSIFDSFSLRPVQSHHQKLGCSRHFPAGNYMFKVNIRNTRASCEICSKLAIKTLERRQWRHSGVFIVNFNSEHIFHLNLFLLSTLNIFHTFFSVSYVDFEQVNFVGWVPSSKLN